MKNHHPRLTRTLREFAVILALGCLAAVINNSLSPRSIPLVGDWKKAYGLPSPGGAHAPSYGNVEINLDRTLRLFEEGSLFLDARPAAGYREGHIAGAISFPEEHTPEDLDELIETLDPGRAVVVYCQSMECDEAHLLARELRETGVDDVFVFSGGIKEWDSAGHPVEEQHQQNK